MKESDTFGISPYLTESAGEITPKTYRDKESTRKIKVEGYEGRTHPLPDEEKQERMHKRARKWSREGPLLPKEPLKTKSDLTQTQRGRNARKKLEQIVDWNVHDGTNDRGFPIIITGVNVGKGQKRTRGGGKWVWAAYVGDVRVTEGKTFYDEKGNIRGRAPSKVKGGISRRRRVKGGRDTTVLDYEAVEKVKCPLCKQPKGKNCVVAKGENKGQKLPIAKTHGIRVRKYVKDVLKKDWAYGKGKGQYRGDTGE